MIKPFSVVVALILLAKMASSPFKGDDVMASVNGERITRRELTYFWVRTDQKAAQQVGDLLMKRWGANGFTRKQLTLPDSALYKELYTGIKPGSEPYAARLANLINGRTLAIEAAKEGIIVTQKDAWTAAHLLLDQARKQQNLTLTDSQMLAAFHVPRSILLEDMRFKIRAEKLYSSYIQHKIGHPVQPDDWIIVRELFASSSKPGGEQSARKRLLQWLQDIKNGETMTIAAQEHNENDTARQGGLLAPAMRGTGSPAVEKVIFSLPEGKISPPVQTKKGWYAFEVIKKGSQLNVGTRSQLWNQLEQQQLPSFLAYLRNKMVIKSVIPLFKKSEGSGS